MGNPAVQNIRMEMETDKTSLPTSSSGLLKLHFGNLHSAEIAKWFSGFLVVCISVWRFNLQMQACLGW